MNVVLLSSFLVGVLCIGMGIPLALGKVPRNHFYGYRTLKTMSSPEIWAKANTYSGKAFVVSGAATVVLSLLLLVAQRQHLLSLPTLSVVGFLAQVVPLLVGLVYSALYVRGLS